jgi:hypothetical protein
MIKSVFMLIIPILSVNLAYSKVFKNENNYTNLNINDSTIIKTINKSNASIILQGGTNKYHELTPSLNIGLNRNINKKIIINLFFETILKPFTDEYNAIKIQKRTFQEYGYLSNETGPFPADYDLTQYIFGLSLLYSTDNHENNDHLLFGGGIGYYLGSWTSKIDYDLSIRTVPFKNTLGYHIDFSYQKPINNKIGVLFTAKYHLIKREVKIEHSNQVTLKYDSYGNIKQKCNGDICIGYENEYDEIGRMTGLKEYINVDTSNKKYYNMCFQIGLYFKI